MINILETNNTKGVIIDEKEGKRGSHLTKSFTYYYQFSIKEKSYKNPSYDEKYRIGDSVNIKYSEKFPFINRIIEK